MRHTPINQNVRPDLPVQESGFDKLPLESVVLRDPHTTVCLFLVVLVLQAVNNKSTFFFCQERGTLGKVEESEVCNDCHDDSQYALQDEDPAPSRKISYAVHVCDAKGKEAREGACDRGSGEEEGLAELRFVSGVPHSDVVCYSWE